MGLSYYKPPQQNTFSTKIVSGMTAYQITVFDNGLAIGSNVESLVLPAEPQINQRYKIFDYEGDSFGNNITIYGNGNTINGESSIVLNTDGASVELIFVQSGWHVTSFVN